MKSNRSGLENNLKLIAKTSFIVFVGLVISKILGYAYRVIIARSLGPEIYGLFNLSIMIIGLFVTIASLGLSDGLVRYLSIYRERKQEDKLNYIFKISLWITSITSIVSGLILFIFANFISISIFHEPQLIIYLQILSIAVPATVLMSVFLSVLRAYEKIEYYSFIFNILQNIFRVSLLILLLVLGIKTNAIPLSYTFGMILTVVVTYYFTNRLVPNIFITRIKNLRNRKPILKELFNYSIPLTFHGLLITLFFWVDSFSLGYYKTVFEVGIYGAATAIALLLNLVPEIFSQLFFPLISKEYSKGNKKLVKELSKQVGKWIFIFSLPAFLLIIIFPGAALNILFGSDYLPATNALRILAFGALLSTMGFISNQLLSIIGKSKLVLFNSLIAVIVNFILNAFLVPMNKIAGIDNASGINGAAIATLISLILFNLLFIIQAYRNTLILPFRRKMLSVLILSIIPTLLLLYVRKINESRGLFYIGIMCLLFFIIYFVLMFIFKAFDRNDLLIIRKVFEKFGQPLSKFRAFYESSKNYLILTAPFLPCYLIFLIYKNQ